MMIPGVCVVFMIPGVCIVFMIPGVCIVYDSRCLFLFL